MVTAFPRPRPPLDDATARAHPAHPGPLARPRPLSPISPSCPVRDWYERELGWATAAGSAPGEPELLTGLRFDVLDLPADAGFALLRRMPRTGPVVLERGPRGSRGRVRLLVAAGSAEKLPELLDWLEWGGIALELSALGAGGRMTAPRPHGRGPLSEPSAECPSGSPERPSAGPRGAAGPRDAHDRRGAAGGRLRPVWLRPPEPGCEVEPTLPAAPVWGGTRAGGVGEAAPDLVRLVGAAATECHRARLVRARAQPFAFSYASRTVAGTRPRSLTS